VTLVQLGIINLVTGEPLVTSAKLACMRKHLRNRRVHFALTVNIKGPKTQVIAKLFHQGITI